MACTTDFLGLIHGDELNWNVIFDELTNKHIAF